MSPMRWLSSLCLVLCGWCAGDSIHLRTQAHLDALSRVLTLLEILHREISFRRCDLNQLQKKLIAENLLSEDTESFQTLMPFPQLTTKEKLCFSECFSGLGHAEAELECRRLETYIVRFQEFLQESQTKAKTQNELSHKLGLAAGLAAAILLV